MSDYKFNPEEPVIVLHADLEGKNDFFETLKMVIDTGATYTLIPWRIATALGLEPEISNERLDLTTASGVERVPVVVLDAIRVGDKNSKGTKAVVHDLPQKGYVDGLLGLSFLKNFKLTINFKAGILSLE